MVYDPNGQRLIKKVTTAGTGDSPTVTVNTLYIGNLYEEELTGAQNPPYTAYYSFGGKLVGMRRANYPDGNGQLRIVGDWLGSTTLVLDTASPPNVVGRQYYKPYGEVALSQGSSRTSVGYTGQRLDGESGLMFYNARFYDPVLSYFVSADTIAPNPADPKTRNRYSYVLNNPLRYSDPSGHCKKDTADDSEARKACNDYLRQLGSYGIEIGDLDEWSLEDVFLALTAIKDMAGKAGWSPDEFKKEMGLGKDDKITLLNSDLNGGCKLQYRKQQDSGVKVGIRSTNRYPLSDKTNDPMIRVTLKGGAEGDATFYGQINHPLPQTKGLDQYPNCPAHRPSPGHRGPGAA